MRGPIVNSQNGGCLLRQGIYCCFGAIELRNSVCSLRLGCLLEAEAGSFGQRYM